MKRLLIANRGEIALRIVRACKELGVESVAAYTQVDSALPHLELADDTVCIGRRSYMDADQLLAAAISRQCDAIHPGYGFLSENSVFSAKAEASGLEFVGPSSNHIAMMGNKSSARSFMRSHDVPVLPGSLGELASLEEAISVAEEIGFPVMLKASAGGGGRGIAVVHDADQLASTHPGLVAQAEGLFTDGSVYLEKYLEQARHIELQIFGDGQGGILYLGARDCSIQRKHQKVVEEAPPPGIDAKVLKSLAEQCCTALSELKYRNAGTLEFLFEDDAFYFIEMNTRIQVEHPVTEMCTGIDLVKLQIAHALYGHTLPLQSEISERGSAIECRINAEDELFNPAPGIVDVLRWPGGPGIRIDSHLYQGIRIAHEYDSLVAKIIAHGANRLEAIARMHRAVLELQIKPGPTNRKLHLSILEDPRFITGDLSTRFLD